MLTASTRHHPIDANKIGTVRLVALCSLRMARVHVGELNVERDLERLEWCVQQRRRADGDPAD